MKRTYIELLRGGFVIHRFVRTVRTDDPDSISEKWADYSAGTISRLFKMTIVNNLKERNPY